MEDEVALAIKARERVLDMIFDPRERLLWSFKNLPHSDQGNSIGPFQWLWTRTIQNAGGHEDGFFTIFCPLVKKLRKVAILFCYDVCQ